MLFCHKTLKLHESTQNLALLYLQLIKSTLHQYDTFSNWLNVSVSLVKNLTRSSKIFKDLHKDPCGSWWGSCRIFIYFLKGLVGSFKDPSSPCKVPARILQVPAKILEDPSGPCKDPWGSLRSLQRSLRSLQRSLRILKVPAKIFEDP